MSSQYLNTDDFKKIFDAHQMPNLPANMEDNIMGSIDIQTLQTKYHTPKWISSNLLVFSISVILLVLLFVFQFVTEFQFPLLADIKLLLAGTAGVCFMLWLADIAEKYALTQFDNETQTI